MFSSLRIRFRGWPQLSKLRKGVGGKDSSIGLLVDKTRTTDPPLHRDPSGFAFVLLSLDYFKLLFEKCWAVAEPSRAQAPP